LSAEDGIFREIRMKFAGAVDSSLIRCVANLIPFLPDRQVTHCTPVLYFNIKIK
jgi:hypothetical protein